jgi:hypothetical protein
MVMGTLKGPQTDYEFLPWRARTSIVGTMRALLYLILAGVGVALATRGVRLSTTRPRPLNLAGMVMAAVGVGVALSALSIAAGHLGG